MNTSDKLKVIGISPIDMNTSHVSPIEMNTTEGLNASNVTGSSNRDEEHVDVMTILQSGIACVGIVANLSVVVTFLYHEKLRCKIPNLFIVNQSILDCCVSIVLLLSTLTIRNYRVIRNTGILGDVECRLWNAQPFLWGLFLCSTWNLVSMTLERYVELIHPIWHKTHFKKRWIYIGLAVNCFLSIPFQASHNLASTKVVSGVCAVMVFWPSQTVKGIYGVILFMIEYFIPLCILLYCYGRIVWMLTRRIESSLGDNDNGTRMFQLARKNTVKAFILISVCFGLGWSCSQFQFLLYNLGHPTDWTGTFFKVATLLAYGNCTINPFVYLVIYKDYQQGLKYLCFCRPRQKDNVRREFPHSRYDISVIRSNEASKGSVTDTDTYSF